MKYFARYESNQNYDQGLSWGDGYHAMGYYQFDNRYALKSFLVACYNYDSTKYSMFGWVANTDISGDLYDWDAGELTEVGKRLNDSWHTAYANNPTEFAGLQDSYTYENYYVPADNGTLPPDTTTPPTDNDNPSNEPEDEPSNEPQEPEDTTPPADNGTDQGGSNDVVKPDDKEEGTTTPPTEDPKPEEGTKPDTTPPSEETTTPPDTTTGSDAPKEEEPTKEVVDKEETTLEEPSTAAQEPRDLPKSESTDQASENKQANGEAKTSNLTQTGDDTLKGPLGVALASAGVTAIAGAALATRRILK